MQITLPHPPQALNPNGSRVCWQGVSAARRRARELACAETCALLEANPAAGNTRYNSYEIEWNAYGHQQADDDNIIARCKSYKDGICEALGINDRGLRCAGVTFTRSKCGKKTLTIRLSEQILLPLTPQTGASIVRALRRLAELDKAAYAAPEQWAQEQQLADLIQQKLRQHTP